VPEICLVIGREIFLRCPDNQHRSRIWRSSHPLGEYRFNPEKIRDLNEVVSPPYDVINDRDGEALVRRNPYNMIQLDLRNDPNAAADSNGTRYREARNRFDAWQSDEVLIRDEQPAMYLYFIDYTHPSGRRLTRKGLVPWWACPIFPKGWYGPMSRP